MPLEAIENITRVEAENKERRTAAEAQAKQMIADAQRNGLALLKQTQEAAEAREKALLRQAEEAGYAGFLAFVNDFPSHLPGKFPASLSLHRNISLIFCVEIRLLSRGYTI